MQIKEVKPINFLYLRTKTKVSDLGRFVGIIARELHRDAALYDLEVTGPVYWNYFGFDGHPATEFILEIALPVAEIPEAYGGKFRLKRSEAFTCVSLIHEGSWYDIPQSYARLMKFIRGRKLTPKAENREVYINMDFAHPEANVTEIQMGIQDEAAGLVNASPVATGALVQA